jgi:signal transduction histidine kinase
MKQTYKSEASREVAQKGQRIEREILKGASEAFGDNFSGYLRFLSSSYNVDLFILDASGHVLFPQEHNLDPNAPELSDVYDYSDEMEKMLRKMGEQKSTKVVFEENDFCIYGSKLADFNDEPIYLYVGKSMDLIRVATAKMSGRMIMIAVFVFLLSFVLSSVLSGWLSKPIAEMTDKAKQLAHGNFDVDFHGTDYGQEMVELADSLNFARDELSKTDHMQKELIANVSHDFKTPLTMIKAYASMIMEISGDIPEKRNKHAQVIVDESDRLTSLVADVLDLSKMNSGIETMQKDLVDMSKEAFQILDRFAYLKETGGYQFITYIEKDCYTCADRMKIEQVLYNLIGNAVNYTGEDKKVYVRIERETQNTFRFSVTDTGSGIKPEELSAVWDRYYRSSEMHKRPVKGTGLGLSIVKRVLEKHQFRFGINSTVGQGSTFYVIFPLVEIVEEMEDDEE